MNHLFVTANHYYSALERVGIQYMLKSFWIWILTILMLLFVGLGWALVTSTEKPEGILLFIDWRFLTLIGLEFVLLAIFERLKSLKKTVILDRVNDSYKQSFSSVEQARRYLLKRMLGRSESEYLAFVDEIQKAIAFHDQLRNPLAFSFSRFGLFVYDPDSKQRIYALMLVMVSVLTALSIREGASILNVFEFFSDENFALVVLVWLLLVVFLAGLLMLILVIRIGVEILWEYLSVRIDGEAARNIYTLKYMQRDLLTFHRFVHLKVAHEGDANEQEH